MAGRGGREVWRWDVCISFPAGGVVEVGGGVGGGEGGGEEGGGGGVAGRESEADPPAKHGGQGSSAATHHPTASWRRMYLSQPPCTALYLVRRWRRCGRKAIERAGGITMGDFVDEVMAKGAVGGVGGAGSEGADEGGWSEGLIASDRDWHFEGTVGEGVVG